jgi:outer membrane protein assembly factor BamA
MLSFSFSFSPTYSFGQLQPERKENLSGVLIIHKITIIGNSITRKSIILRELKFKERDTIPSDQFSGMLITGRQNVFNTRLFNFVTIDTSFTGHPRMADVTISVVERWYIWPIPFLEISDRNFNVWWETRDFSRLTYGVDFTFFNARGRNETLKILTHFGYNQKYGFTYKMPYINKKQTLGITYGAAIELNRELPVATVNNKPVYFRSNSVYLKKMIGGFAELNLRPDFFSIHAFRISYSYYDFDSAIRSIPGYVMLPQNVQQFFSFSYLYKNDHRDVQYYPLKGYYFDVEIHHAVPYSTAHNTFLQTNLRIYRQLRSRWYCASGFAGKLSFEKNQPYYLQRGLGFGRDFVRGYEYYVIDGQHYALLKNNLKFAVLPQHIGKIGFIKSSKFNTIPVALYLNAFTDMGFAYHYQGNGPSEEKAGNTLENTFLIGYGLGLDFTTYYDIVVRLEGAMNKMFQPGVYLHFIAPI